MSKLTIPNDQLISGITLSEIKTRSPVPVTYRLARYPCGKEVLQGGFSVQVGFSDSHIEWENIQVVEVDENGEEKPQNQPDE